VKKGEGKPRYYALIRPSKRVEGKKKKMRKDGKTQRSSIKREVIRLSSSTAKRTDQKDDEGQNMWEIKLLLKRLQCSCKSGNKLRVESLNSRKRVGLIPKGGKKKKEFWQSGNESSKGGGGLFTPA